MSTDRHHCAQFDSSLDDPDVPLDYRPEFREISIRVLDGGTSGLAIRHCPFCGATLAGSLREDWFDQIEELGLDPESPQIPAAMRSDSWWRRGTR
ncbi:MAG: DUF6980 family protein [Actinomycetales bacterium]